MMKTLKYKKWLAFIIAGLFAAGGSLAAQEDDTDPPETDPGPPHEDLRELIEQFREGQQNRVQARRELAQSLQDLPADERRQAMRTLIEEQTAEQRSLGRQIRERMQEEAEAEVLEHRESSGREERPSAAATDLADEVRTLNDEFRATRDALLEEWRETVKELRDANEEERRAAFEAFRNELRENREAVREAALDRAAERRNRGNGSD